MTTTKKHIQRNLPIDTSYKLIESYYSSIEESGCSCDNCGRLISNIAVVQDTKRGVQYNVGMDCAGTLTGIKGDFNYEWLHKIYFNEAKSARAAVMKMIKRGATEVTAKTFAAGEGFYKEEGAGMWSTNGDDVRQHRNWKQYPASSWLKYVYPMIKDILTA
jgi:hypothetical protein